jgi:hypothetical protein
MTTEVAQFAGEDRVEIGVRGQRVKVPSVRMGSVTAIVTGRWLKLARLRDEELIEGKGLEDPEALLRKVKAEAGADILIFAAKFPEAEPKYEYHFEVDNLAAILITSYEDWWNGLSQETRRNVRKASKAGLIIREANYDDAFVRGIKEIYDETPVRQGRRFWHYNKDFEIVKAENGTYLDRSQFIGAFLEDKLVGFIKLIYTGRLAYVIQILSMTGHQDKRPTNALIAKAVEICAREGKSHLIYCKYNYGKEETSQLTEFKRRSGFQKFNYPRYFVPISLKGRLAIWLNLHLPLRDSLPQPIVDFLLRVRAIVYEGRNRGAKRGGPAKKSLPGHESV